MLAEAFMLRLEANLRASKLAANDIRFVGSDLAALADLTSQPGQEGANTRGPFSSPLSRENVTRSAVNNG